MGDENVSVVRFANAACDETAFLCLSCYVSKQQYVVEQPVSSTAHYVPQFKLMLALTGAFRVSTYHGAFAGHGYSAKPLKLWSSASWILKMKKPMPARSMDLLTVTKVVGKKQCVIGKGQALKGSECYCRAFAKACFDYMATFDDGGESSCP